LIGFNHDNMTPELRKFYHEGHGEHEVFSSAFSAA
jgi:hypothetical protein